MQVSVKSTGSLERTMQVEVPEEQIAQQVASRLQNLTRTTRVPGFRAGKVPLKVIQQRFGDQVRREVIGEVLQSSFIEAINREKLRPAASPRIEPLDAASGAGLRYTARFEVLPELELAAMGSLKLEKPTCAINEGDVDRMTETLRQQRRRLEPVERPAARDDVVEFDFHGTVDGAPFDGGDSENFKAELGKGRLIPGLEDTLVGKRSGDTFTFEHKFADDHADEKLRGKQAEYRVTVKQVLEPVLPELDEEFFRAFGVQSGGMEAFRAEVREHMEREMESVIRSRLRTAVMNALHGAHDLDLPASLVSMEAQRLQEQWRSNMKAYGIEAQEADERAGGASVFEEQAKKRVALQLIVDEIVRRHELKPDPAKVRKMIEKSAQSYQDTAAIINWYYADHKRLAEVEAVVLEDEVIDWVCGQAEVSPVEVPFDELVNKGQTEPV